LHEEFEYIDTAQKLASLTAQIDRQDRLAVDVEADSFHHYYEKVCLIQLAVNGCIYLIDPLAGLDLSTFIDALAHRVLIFHDGGYDLRMLRQSFAFEPRRPVFDTMLAAQLLGYREFGLAALLRKLFDLDLPKTHQKANWSCRPLDNKLLSYAANDVKYLHRLTDELESRLRELGRLSWHEQTCGAMVRAAQVEKPAADGDRQWRIKGTRPLKRRQLAYVRRLWHWRQQEAERADLPPFKIIGNVQLIELAMWAESHTKAALHKGPRLPRHFVGDRLERLQAAIRQAAELPEPQWPETLRRRTNGPPGPEFCRTVDTLKEQCRSKAEELGIEPFVLAPRSTLSSIAQRKPRDEAELIAAGAMQWQAGLLWPIVSRFLHT